jgi:hypothetical protein
MVGLGLGVVLSVAIDVIFIPYAKRTTIRKMFIAHRNMLIISSFCFVIAIATYTTSFVITYILHGDIDLPQWSWLVPTFIASIFAAVIMAVSTGHVNRYIICLYHLPDDKRVTPRSYPIAYKEAKRAYKAKQPIYDPRQDDGARLRQLRQEQQRANSTDTFEGAWKVLQQSPHTIEDERALKERFAHGGTVSASGAANTTNTASATGTTNAPETSNATSTSNAAIGAKALNASPPAPKVPLVPPAPKAPKAPPAVSVPMR